MLINNIKIDISEEELLPVVNAINSKMTVIKIGNRFFYRDIPRKYCSPNNHTKSISLYIFINSKHNANNSIILFYSFLSCSLHNHQCPPPWQPPTMQPHSAICGRSSGRPPHSRHACRQFASICINCM